MRFTTLIFLCFVFVFGHSPAHAGGVNWRAWAPEIFEQARKNDRLVILDLKAVWCHWCHVMDEKTYQNPRVAEILNQNFVAVRVDQDASPDLSMRYGDWGWPATIIFDAEGTELVKMRGYLPPERMISLLDAVVADPTPGPSAFANEQVAPADSAFLTRKQRDAQIVRFFESYDDKNAGWGSRHKFIHTDSMDYALARAESGDETFLPMVRKTLDAGRLLIDPEWGGVYQYSDQADWRGPHYEKIMWYQAQYIRHYSQAFAKWKHERDLESAKLIAEFLIDSWTSPEGAFYTSQDADVDATLTGDKFYSLSGSQRKALGRQPKIDKNIYARENGWAIQGLVSLFTVTGDAKMLDQAERAAQWIVSNRNLPGGGFRHGENDKHGPFLGDTLAMGRAALDLYAATGKRTWLKVATDAGHFIAMTFKSERGGFQTSNYEKTGPGVFAAPVRAREEQPRVARFYNLLFRYTGDMSFRDNSHHALQFMASSSFLGSGRPNPGLLIAEYEATREPIHITVVGHKDHLDAQKLHLAARRYPATYKRIDWWDKREGPLPNPDITYPELDRPAAFACSQNLCSLPAFSPKDLGEAVERMTREPERAP